MADYATLLRDHVSLGCRCIDRIFLQAWVPKHVLALASGLQDPVVGSVRCDRRSLRA
jgi:hypothetical protein